MPKLSSKNQVTIPVDILRETGLEAGDDLRIRATGSGRVEIERVRDFIERWAGSMPAGTWPPGEVDRLRDEWER